MKRILSDIIRPYCPIRNDICIAACIFNRRRRVNEEEYEEECIAEKAIERWLNTSPQKW